MTQPTPAQHLHQLFVTRGGYLTADEVRAAGIYPKLMDRFVRQGLAERVQRGVYRLTERAPPAHADLLEVQLAAPYARPCLATALDLHGLTTTRPIKLQFAIPRNRVLPNIAYPPVEAFYWSQDRYKHGNQHINVGGRDLITYTPEKTIADLLRAAPTLGPDLYYEGLKNYLALSRHPNTRALLEAARVDGVELQLRRDLEVLRHEPNA